MWQHEANTAEETMRVRVTVRLSALDSNVRDFSTDSFNIREGIAFAKTQEAPCFVTTPHDGAVLYDNGKGNYPRRVYYR